MGFNLNIGNVLITDFDTTITDVILGFVGFGLGWKTCLVKTKFSLAKWWIVVMYFSIGVSSLLAALAHGFFTTVDLIAWESGYEYVWHPSLVFFVLGSVATYFTAYNVLSIIRQQYGISFWQSLKFGHELAIVFGISVVHLVLLSLYIILVNDSFLPVSLDYAIAGLTLSFSVILYWFFINNCKSYSMICSILVLFAGVFGQNLKLSIHPVYCDHNATFHLIQNLGFVILFSALQTILLDENLNRSNGLSILRDENLNPSMNGSKVKPEFSGDEGMKEKLLHALNGLLCIFNSSTKNHRSFFMVMSNYWTEVLEYNTPDNEV